MTGQPSGGEPARPDGDGDRTRAPGDRVRDSVFGIVVDASNSLGSALIIAIMAIVCADVVSRGLFNHPIDGVSELVALSIVAIVFLQLASTLRHGRMARAEIFIGPFRQRRPAAGGLLQAFFELCGLLVCLIILWATLPKLEAAWTGNVFVGVHGQFTAPTWPVRLIVAVGAAMAILQFALRICRDLRLAARGRPD